jgi:bifunctional non-homologous end joining protein LigD
MAVYVEDHPVSYGNFEGTIPRRQYGAGHVIVWDRGTWEPVNDPRAGIAQGKLVFRLHGEKLAGLWELVRIRKPGEQRQDPRQRRTSGRVRSPNTTSSVRCPTA